MSITGMIKSLFKRYVLKKVKDDARDEEYVYAKSASIRHGMTIWNRGNSYWVVRYPVPITISAVIFIWITIDHVLNFHRISWLTKIFDYNYPIGASLYAYTLYSQTEAIARVSRVLDKWWNYSFLEKVQEELKRSAEDRVKRFSYMYYKFMKIGGVSYCLMPIWHYYYSLEKDSSYLLLFQCWSPFPLTTWWGFSVTYLLELIITVSVFILFGSLIIYLITAVITIGVQCQLISTALVTIDHRVTVTLNDMDVHGSQWAEVHARTMQEELKHCIIHFQRIYGLCQETCGFFTGPINICYYNGMFVLVLCCAKLATERENKFLLFQATFMAAAILVNQYIIAYINQIITDEIENLGLAVYDCLWYRMGIPCRKMIHIMQSMFLRKPNIRTLLGTRADMEFFATVCNASYCYLSALLSMNINY